MPRLATLSRHAHLIAWAALCAYGPNANAFLSSIGASTDGAVTLEFTCDVRYLSHAPKVVSDSVRIRLMTQTACAESGREVFKINDPRVADADIVVSNNGATLILDFHDRATYLISQGTDPREIIVFPRMQRPAPTDTATAPANTQASAGKPTDASDPELESNLADAKSRLLDGDYDAGIRLYEGILASTNTRYHPEAGEYLALAHQKAGRREQAIVDYEAWLARHPNHPSASRVRQRLDALVVQARPVRPVTTVRRDQWQWHGGISQDFWQDSFTAPALSDLEPVTGRVLLTRLGALVRREGKRFDIQTRIDAAVRNELEARPGQVERQSQVSNAYVAVNDSVSRLSARLGRQTLFQDGILGRFDGLHASYALWPTVHLNATVGVPVDTPRYTGDSRRRFAGLAVGFENVLERFDARAYVHLQDIDGVADRQAVGSELRMSTGKAHLVGLVDYDVSYGVLNNGLLHASYRATDRFEVHGRVNAYAMPYLTTRNALIGQPVATIDELSRSYPEGQLRTLARHRTTDVLEVAAGFSRTLTSRWSFNAETTYRDIASNVSSAGVAALPALQEFHTVANFIGSSVLRDRDTLIVGYRLHSTPTADTNTLQFDLRLPFGQAFRLNPSLALAHRESPQTGTRVLIHPRLRLMYQWGRRYRLEFEAGVRESTFEVPEHYQTSPLYPASEETQSEQFLLLRWQADF